MFDPLKPTLAAVAALAAVQQPTPLEVTFNVVDGVPIGKRDIAVEVGDVVTIVVVGPPTCTGRRLTITGKSYTTRHSRDGCRNVETEIPHSLNGDFPTEARFFDHYYPAVHIPGQGVIELRDPKKTTLVIRERGNLRVEKLVTPDLLFVILNEKDRVVQKNELNAKEREMVEQIERNRRHHHNFTKQMVLHKGSIGPRPVQVTVTIQRTK